MRPFPVLALSSLLTIAAGPAAAQGNETADRTIRIELNGLEPSQQGCRFTFVAENGLEVAIERAAYEVALFGKDGLVQRLTVLDFKDLPAGRTKVRQFDLPEVDCADIGRVLINDAAACEGGEGLGEKSCIASLKTKSRGEVGFGL